MIEALKTMFTYDFMCRALIATVLVMPLFSLLGTLVVGKGMAFFSDALGHSALTGVGIGVIFGFAEPLPAMILFAAVFALLMNAIRHSRLSSTDTVIGVFSSCGIALGLLILSRGDFSGYQSLLIGDLLSVTTGQLWAVGITLLAVVLIWVLFFNGFLATTVNLTLAKSRGIRARLLDDLFVVVIAVVVMLAIRWVGLLLINALLILPAAAARNVARSVRGYTLLSVIFSLFSGLLGLFLSYCNAIATGPTIVLISAAIFFGTYLIGRKK